MQSPAHSSDTGSEYTSKGARKRSTISRRAIMAMTLFSLFLLAGVMGVANYLYVKVKTEDATDVSYAYAKAASRFIDGDRVGYYAATGRTDEYYHEVDRYLSSLLKTSGLEYFYVVVPTRDGAVYVWDPMSDSGVSQYEPGHKVAYPEGYGYEDYKRVFSGKPEEICYYITDEAGEKTMNALYPVYDSEGQSAALVGVSINAGSFAHDLRAFMLAIAAAIAAIVVMFALFLYFYTRYHIIEPLSILNRSTREVVSTIGSDTDISYDIHTGDEIEDLAKSFMSMRQELNDYLKALSRATAEKERIKTELNVATSIQSSMLPKLKSGFKGRTDFKICASMTTAKEVGGDFYDAFLIDDEHLAIVIADVSGKGVPAALFMVISKTLIKMRSQLSRSLSTSRVFAAVNQQLLEGNEASMFVTAYLALIDLKTGIAHASNAGHEHPVLRRAGGEFKLVEYQHSPPLGCLEGLEFEEHEFRLDPGDTFFVYTDGVAEACNEKGELYGTAGLVKALNATDISEPESILAAVHGDLKKFVGSAEQFDDITMLAFKYCGKNDDSDQLI